MSVHWTYCVTKDKGLTLFRNAYVYSIIAPKYGSDQRSLNAIHSARHLYDIANLMLSDEQTSVEEANKIINMVHQASLDLIAKD